MTEVLHLMMRHMSKRPINSVKNIVDGTFLGVTGGTNTDVVLVDTVNDYTGTSGTVPIGATVSSLYLFVQMISADSGVANHDWFVIKDPGDQLIIPVPGATGGVTSRKFILHEEKGIPGNALDGAYPLTFKGVIKIPPGYRRCGEDDRIVLRMRGVDLYNACVKCIYKFYQ